jgi:hypothetical protein
MKISEPFVMMVPRMFGGSSDHLEVPEDKSKAIEPMAPRNSRFYQALAQQMPPQQAQQLTQQIAQQSLELKFYWGGMTKASEVGVSGPPYVGAIICFLALLGMFLLDNKYKWWIITRHGYYYYDVMGQLFRRVQWFPLEVFTLLQ